MQITHGKRLDEIAKAEGISEVDLYIRIVQDGDAGVIGHTMAEEDMKTFYRQPWCGQGIGRRVTVRVACSRRNKSSEAK